MRGKKTLEDTSGTLYKCDISLLMYGKKQTRNKHRVMRVLNNFDHLETWKPILNGYFDCEKDRFFFHTLLTIQLIHIMFPMRPQVYFPTDFTMTFDISRNCHDVPKCGYKE